MEDAIKLQKKIIKIDLAILAVLICTSFVLSKNPMPWVKGFIFGGLMGVLNFMLLGKTIEKAMAMEPSRAQRYTTSNYFIRMIILGIVIIIGFKADYLNAFAVIIGLLLIKQVILLSQVFCDKKFLKKIFKRKEGNE